MLIRIFFEISEKNKYVIVLEKKTWYQGRNRFVTIFISFSFKKPNIVFVNFFCLIMDRLHFFFPKGKTYVEYFKEDFNIF